MGGGLHVVDDRLWIWIRGKLGTAGRDLQAQIVCKWQYWVSGDLEIGLDISGRGEA